MCFHLFMCWILVDPIIQSLLEALVYSSRINTLNTVGHIISKKTSPYMFMTVKSEIK